MEVVDVLGLEEEDLSELSDFMTNTLSEAVLDDLYDLHTTENEYYAKLFRLNDRAEDVDEDVFTYPDEDDLNTVTGYVYGKHDDTDAAMDALHQLEDTFLTAFRLATGRVLPEDQHIEAARKAHADALADMNEALSTEDEITAETLDDVVTGFDDSGDWVELMPPRFNFDGVPERQ